MTRYPHAPAGVACGHDHAIVDAHGVGGVRLRVGYVEDLGEASRLAVERTLPHLARGEQAAVLEVGASCLEVQDALEFHLLCGESPCGKECRELAEPLVVGACGSAHIVMVVDHHDIAALERAGSLDELDLLVREERAQRGDHVIGLVQARRRAGTVDHDARGRDDAGVLHEDAVGELLERG